MARAAWSGVNPRGDDRRPAHNAVAAIDFFAVAVTARRRRETRRTILCPPLV
jgi:hypothetical protein